MDTPFQWTKQIASHFGGTRNGMVISWPARIKDKGGIRTQFHRVIDIAPSILEAAGLQMPAVLNGVPQKPIEGVSMVFIRRCESGLDPPHSIFRDVRQSRHLQRWLRRRHYAAAGAVAIGKTINVDDYKWEL